MGAYQAFSIPLQWLGSLLAVSAFIMFLYMGRTYRRFYFYPLFIILLLLFISTLGWWYWSTQIDFSMILPPGATTDYYVYIFLRYLQIFAFVSVYFLCVSFLRENGVIRLANMVIFFGVVASIYAIYVYIAQIYGLYEVPRNRIGTGGEEQSIIFTYAFHRAMGTFREPSHLAQWLVLPFFMTFMRRSYNYLGARITILLVILLTGSLTGILSVFAGYLLAMFVVFSLRTAFFRVINFAIVLSLAAYLFSILALPNEGGSVDILSVLLERLIPIISDGMEASNRAHVYEYVYHHSVPAIGYGFGNANLLVGDYMGIGLVGSFLSLYLNMIYSIGYFGIGIAIIFMIAPVFLLLYHRTADKNQLFVILGSYVGWLLIYSVLTEELSISFAIIYAMCMHYFRERLDQVSIDKPAVSVVVKSDPGYTN